MCERLLIVVCLFQTHAQGAKFYLVSFISKPRTMRELLLIRTMFKTKLVSHLANKILNFAFLL